jgi:DNA-binding response OmpR family regulator
VSICGRVAFRFDSAAGSRAGHVVVEAGDGAAGLERLRASRPDLILLDLTMPVMDGWEFRAQQQRLSDPQLAQVPVVLRTALADARHQVHVLGAREVIPKPVAPEILLSAVARHAVRGTATSNLPLAVPKAERLKAPILVIDDDPSALESYAHALSTAGYEVRTAAAVESAVAELASTIPAAVVLDLHLSAADGLEFLRRLRAKGHAHLPVAMVTGDYLIADDTVREIESLGAEIFFKPLWVEDLIRIVRGFTEGSS